MIDEAYVSAALHDLADNETIAEPPTQHLLQRARRRRRLRAGATVSAAAVVAAVAVTGVAAMPGGGDGLAGAQQSPMSYRFTLTIVSHTTPSDQPGTVMVSNGAYDPVHRRGFMNTDYNNERQVAVGDVCYTRDRYRSRWVRTAEPCPWADGPDRLPAWISPAEVFDQLEQRGTVEYVGRTGTGGNKVDVWRFSYGKPTEDPPPLRDLAVTGTIEVNASTGRVSKVASHVPTGAGYISPTTQTFVEMLAMEQTVEYRDYGKPVSVTEPTDFVNVAPSPR